VANARGWPRRAREEAEIAASLAPRDLGSRIALVEVAITRYRFAEAQRMVDELLALYPENQGVRRLAATSTPSAAGCSTSGCQPSNSDGGGANASGRRSCRRRAFTRRRSPTTGGSSRSATIPMHGRPRASSSAGARARRVEWRMPVVTATVYPTPSWGTLTKAGGGRERSIGGSPTTSSWQAPPSCSRPARRCAGCCSHHGGRICCQGAVPLARIAQRRGKLLLSAVHPTATSASPAASPTASGWSTSGLRPHRPGRGLRLEQHAGGLTPYYNPSRDLSLVGAFWAEHVLWRRYDTSLVQALRSTPASMPSRACQQLDRHDHYEHRWRFDPLTEFATASADAAGL
jgi:hypothetical protein